VGSVPKPVIALLVGTVVFFALWMTALKPSSSGSPPHGLGQYQSAINAARNAVSVSAAANAARGAIPQGSSAAAPAASAPLHDSAKPVRATTATTTHSTTSTGTQTAKTAATRLNLVSRALEAGKVLALLFYNPAAPDDQAVRHELSSIPVHAGKVVKLAIPLSELANYTVVTNQVPVNLSPTLVLINAQRQASTIVGFADTFEIAQRLADALALG